MSDTLKDAKHAWVERVLGVSLPVPGSGPSATQPDPSAAFNRRLAILLPRIKAAAGSPLGLDIKLKGSEAGVFARKKDFARANALLDDAERMLATAVPPRPQAPSTPAPAASPNVVFTASRLAWDQTRKQVQADLQKLEQTVLAECADEPDFATIASNSKILYTVLDYLDERLIDKLDEALNAQSDNERRARQDEAREIIDEYIDYVASDKLLHDIDDNGFVDLAIGATVTGQLKDMAGKLRALARA